VLNKLQREWLTVPALLVVSSFAMLGLSDRLPPADPLISNTNERTANQSANDVPQDAATQTIANYTVMLALFTGVLALVSIWQGSLLNRQMRLARDEFNATHRPKIVIRGLFMVAPNPSHANAARISFQVHNVGDTAALITEFNFFLMFEDEETVEMPIVRTESPGELPQKLGVGDRIFWRGNAQVNPAKFMNATNQAFHFGEGESPLNFRGTVSYEDMGGTVRHTSFHRAYDFNKRRFKRIENSEAEYGD